MTVCRWAACFNLEPPLRITRKVERPKLRVDRRWGLWWEESSPWEDWLVTWQVFRISTGCRSCYGSHGKMWKERTIPHAISLWNMIPGSLLPHFNASRRRAEARQPEHLHFPNKTIQRCAQFPNNSCTIAVGTKSFPAPVSNVVCWWVLR